MSPIDKTRVAEVIVRFGNRAEYGSGYRISSTLVLTVAHLFGSGEDPCCSVLLGAIDDELPATLLWRAQGRDLALLRLASAIEVGSGIAPIPGTVPPVAFGALPEGVSSVLFTGIGFPAYAKRPASPRMQGLRQRDSRQVNGSVQLGSNMKSGLLDLTFTTAPPATRGPDGQDPWQGISGTALFAQDGGLLVGVQAQRLPAAGTGSAEAEPVTEALKDPTFARLLALDGVRPKVVTVDAPGGAPGSLLPAVVRQQELVEGFGDFKKHLTSEYLPFVSPGSSHPADPRNLFVQLVTSDDRAVLLVGAAGTGKTRTGIEVGQLALAAGWRVLHVLPGEDASIIDQIARQVLAETSAVLVVVDYLNDSQLDLPALRHRLIPEAHRRGIQVALLASVRPGWLQKADRALLHELFDEVELRQDDEFQQLVTDNALKTLAPTAVRHLGKDHVSAMCGHRPTVALFVAREIERRVKAGPFVPGVVGLRSGGELPRWLERRLSEDGLTVPGRKDDFTPARASHGLVAAAAAAAACPQTRADVTAAAQTALAAFPGEVPDAANVVATLVSLGWLERDNEDMLSVAHDVVADQLIESVIFPERNDTPDYPRAYAMLAGCLTSPRTIGRFATNIGRLVNDMSLADRAAPISPVLNSWFTSNAAAIGRTMRRDANVGSYALGAICSGPPWSTSAVQCWQEIVNPWLLDFGTNLNARHLLYRGLRNLPGDDALLLVPAALAWLEVQSWRRDASYVLSPLLNRTDLSLEDEAQTMKAALSWLERHKTAGDAVFVLRPLLARADLTDDEAGLAVSAALAWSGKHAATDDAPFVLRMLLGRADLAPDTARSVVSAALVWLGRHATVEDAVFVLRPLLARADLTDDEAGLAVSAALAWLGQHAVTDDAQFVLRMLLARVNVTAGEARRAAGIATAWLEQHAVTEDAQFVLRMLLGRADLTPDTARSAVSAALVWLGRHATVEDAVFVLRPLLARADLTDDEAELAVSAALAWLGQHATAGDAGFVLGPLLLRSDLPVDEVRQSVAVATTWLGHHATTGDAGFVLRPLLLRSDLTAGEVRRAVVIAIAWLGQHTKTSDAQFVMRPLLLRADLTADEVRQAVALASSWLDCHATMAYAEFVLGPLLKRSNLSADEVRRSVSSALTWLNRHPHADKVGFVLQPLLLRSDLTVDEVRQAVAVTSTWLGLHATTGDARFLLRSFLKRSDLTADDVRRAVSSALTWLSCHAVADNAQFVLRPLIERDDLTAEEARRVVLAVLTWTNPRAAVSGTRSILRPLLLRSDLTVDEIRQAVAVTSTWLGRHATTGDAQFVLRPLLKRADLTADEARRAIAVALTWLNRHALIADARFVLRSLLKRADLTADEARRAIAVALTWLNRHALIADAQFVLGPLLSRAELTTDVAPPVISAALAWLDRHTTNADTQFVLHMLVSRTDLTPGQAQHVASMASKQS